MLSRREVLALMGGLPFARPDQHYEAPTGAIVPGARSVITVKKIVIIAGAGGGLFAYSGAPALGNLIASITGNAGTDPKGNAYLPGITAYSSIVGGFGAINFQVGVFQGMAWYTAPVAGGPWTSTGYYSFDSTGQATVSGNLQVLGHIFNGLTITGGLTVDTEILSAALASGVMLDITDTVSTTGTLIRVTTAAIGNTYLSTRVSGDTFVRFIIDTDGSGNPRIRFGSGTATQDVNILRSAANTLAINGADLDVNTVGRGLRVAEGSNAKQGTATLAAGTVVVANTSVTANSRIFLTAQTSGAAPGALRVSARTAGTSFTITSTSATDTSLVAYEIFEPG